MLLWEGHKPSGPFHLLHKAKALVLEEKSNKHCHLRALCDIYSDLKSKKRENPLPQREGQENLLGSELRLKRDRSLEKATNPRPRDLFNACRRQSITRKIEDAFQNPRPV